jgi:hypothetical protein
MDDDMAWVRFTDDFDYEPSEMNGRSTIAYKSGMVLSVRRECADQAKFAGKATELPTPPADLAAAVAEPE